MSNVPRIRVLTGLLFACAATAGFAADEGAKPAVVPNFSSGEFSWVPTPSDFLPPPSGLGPVTYDPANPIVRRSPNNIGNVVEEPLALADVKNPNLKPWVVDYLNKANAELIAGKYRQTSRASCKPAGVPMFLIFGAGFQGMFFMQTADRVTIINSGDTQIRHVYLNVPHSTNPKPSWYGESVGRYEGDELVIDTIGFNDKTFLDDSYNLPHSTQLHVTERFKLIEDGKMLEVNFTVEDPGAFNAPWSGIVRYRRQPQRLSEQPCAENNFDHVGDRYNMPIATKPDF